MEVRYSVAWETVGGVDIAVLRDSLADAEVRVAPALGNTCIGFRIGDWHVLDEPPNETELLNRASSYGIPILFPWPNRVRMARFNWEGRAYRLPPAADEPHAIHGLVRNRPWQEKRLEANEEGALVESEILSTDFPELAEQYPSAFELRVSYFLFNEQLQIEAVTTNTGTRSMPVGFGLHPYFRVPLGAAGSRAACEVRVPARQFWELEDHLPTGRVRPVDGRLDLVDFRPLRSDTYDDVLTDLDPDRSFAQLSDVESGREVLVRPNCHGDRVPFREFVVFAPSHRQIVALEPYSCTTDALNLQARGIDAGLRVLQADERWACCARIETNRTEPP